MMGRFCFRSCKLGFLPLDTRKPPITLKTTCQPSDNLQCYNVSTNTHSNIAESEKGRPFDVENLIKETTFKTVPNFKLPKQNSDYQVIHSGTNMTDDAKKNKNCVTLYPGVIINSVEALLDDASFEAPNNVDKNGDNARIIVHSNISICKPFETMTTSSTTGTLTTCRNLDRSGEIKHAQTPINCSIQQSHSPQLPASSPSYPIQTLLSSNFDCSKITIIESDKQFNNESSSAIKDTYMNANNSKTTYGKESVMQFPNVQPISTTHNNFDDSEMCTKEGKSTVSFWDLHLPYSTASTLNVQVKEREAMSNITIKDLLSHNANKNSLDNKNRRSRKLPIDTVHEANKNSCVVLNVPAVNPHQPPFKKQKISKIDTATKKRKLLRERRNSKANCTKSESGYESDAVKIKKERIVFERITTHKGTVTNFGVPVFGFSDSSSSSSCCSSDFESDSIDIDSKYTKNIPKLDCTKEKVQFLKLFGIITYKKRSAVELLKLEGRKWQPKFIPTIEKSRKLVLDLPVPSITSPPTDGSLKLKFMQILGLQTFPLTVKYGYEMEWLKVIQERTKRKCASSLTDYYLKVHQIYVKSIQQYSQMDESGTPATEQKSENQTFNQKDVKQDKINETKNLAFQNSTMNDTSQELKGNFDILSNRFEVQGNTAPIEQNESDLFMHHQFGNALHNLNGVNNGISNNIYANSEIEDRLFLNSFQPSYEFKQNNFNHSTSSCFNKCNVKNKFQSNEEIKEFNMPANINSNNDYKNTKTCNSTEEFNSSNTILKMPHVISQTSCFNKFQSNEKNIEFNMSENVNCNSDYKNSKTCNSAEEFNSSATILKMPHIISQTSCVNKLQSNEKNKEFNISANVNCNSDYKNSKPCNSTEEFNSSNTILKMPHVISQASCFNKFQSNEKNKEFNMPANVNCNSHYKNSQTCNSAEKFDSSNIILRTPHVISQTSCLNKFQSNEEIKEFNILADKNCNSDYKNSKTCSSTEEFDSSNIILRTPHVISQTSCFNNFQSNEEIKEVNMAANVNCNSDYENYKTSNSTEEFESSNILKTPHVISQTSCSQSNMSTNINCNSNYENKQKYNSTVEFDSSNIILKMPHVISQSACNVKNKFQSNEEINKFNMPANVNCNGDYENKQKCNSVEFDSSNIILKMPHAISQTFNKFQSNEEINISTNINCNNNYENQKTSKTAEEFDASNIILQMPHVMNNSINSKDLTSQCSQTESNYVLPLTMILVDNRTIPQETDDVSSGNVKTKSLNKDSSSGNVKTKSLNKDVSSGIVKTKTLNKAIQCIRVRDALLNKGIQCVRTQEVSLNKAIQCGKSQDVTTQIKNGPNCTSSNADTPKWPGLDKLIESYQLYRKDCNDEIRCLKDSMKNLKETVYVDLRKARTFERERRILQSTVYMFHQERIEIQTKIDKFDEIIDAFR